MVTKTNASQILYDTGTVQDVLHAVTGPTGAASVGYTPAGTGAVATTVQSKLRESVSVFDFMTSAQIADVQAGIASVDVTSAIQAAVDYALSSGRKAVYLPGGSYMVSSTINIGRIRFHGDGADATRIVPYIADGTSVLKFSNISFGSVEKLRITPLAFDVDGFKAGTVNGQNCIGVEFDSSSGNFSRNFLIRDVVSYGLKTGFRVEAFIGTVENSVAYWCETGLIGTLLNSVTLNLNFEGNRKDFQVTNSDGLMFLRCIFEGAVLPAGLVSSTVDDCDGVVFDSLYLEQPRNVPFITVGGTTLVTNVSFCGGSIAAQQLTNDAYDMDVSLIKFDRVDGLNFDASVSPGYIRSAYEVTANAKNVFDFQIARGGAQYSPLDNSNNMVAVKNYFPNPNFDLWFRGWPAAGVSSNVSASKETSIVRSGKNALKITKTAGTTGTGTYFFGFTDGVLASSIAGKTVTLYAWVYIPNISAFDPNYTSNGVAKRTAFPYVSINVNGTGGSTATASTYGGKRGGWNLQRIKVSVPADCTSIYVYLNIQTPAAAVGNEYIIVDSIYIVEGDYAHTTKVTNGWITDSELIQTRGLAGKMVMRSSAAPTDADQTYEVGDQVLNSAPAAGGTVGWVCTTGGVGGVAVWKTFGAIAA